jgi:D-alanine-D-alanine ligase
MPGSVDKSAKIAVLCGGLSSERDVSLRSGKNCFEALQRLGYQNSVMIDMDRQVAERLVKEKVDVVFLALHGRYGEDGCIQGLLEILGIPYTGNRVAASAITMDKDTTKKILKAEGLPIIPSVTIKRNGRNHFPLERFEELRFPVMVKPATEGSSIGMSKVNEKANLESALQLAADHSPIIMVEEFVPGKSITVGVFNKDGKPVVTPILELRTKTEWYDLEAKYTQGMTEFVLPAELPPDVTQAIQETTLKAHQAVGCHGVSRIDFVVDAQNRFYILEVNTIPGMTDLSDLPAQANCMGVGYDELVECILQTAMVGG